MYLYLFYWNIVWVSWNFIYLSFSVKISVIYTYFYEKIKQNKQISIYIVYLKCFRLTMTYMLVYIKYICLVWHIWKTIVYLVFCCRFSLFVLFSNKTKSNKKSNISLIFKMPQIMKCHRYFYCLSFSICFF